ncbi:MAG: signal peptide peptidase [Acidobacteria bacterium]|jgi:protease-4|nr:signal peptide peptidase [Acidobacteriota bacterium]
MSGKRTNLLLWLVIGGSALLFFTVSLVALAVYFSDQEAPSFSLSMSTNQVALLEIEGAIFDSQTFNQQLKDYGKRSGVRAIVLRLNTPGGGVAATQEIYEAVRKFRAETHKKVIASMSSVAASGGYYIACAADKVYANPGTITGSIGVIAEWYNYADLLRWAKMQDVVIKSGEYKDAGNPARPLTEAERAYFQRLIDGLYGQFVAAVATSRKMPDDTVRKLADGRVYTGEEAKRLGLIDELGTLQDAIQAAAKMSGIEGEPKIVTPAKRKLSLLDFLLGESKAALPLPFAVDPSQSQIRFQYLWR